jgi:hypothetical protein
MGFLVRLKFQAFAAMHIESGAFGLLRGVGVGVGVVEFQPEDVAQQFRST